MNIYDGLAKALEVAINRYLDLDPEIKPSLAGLAGKVIAVEFKGLGMTLYLRPVVGAIQVVHDYDGEPDATLIGAPLSLMRMGLGQHGADALLSGDVEIRGDTELGQRFQALLKAVDVDWEEQLSKLTGDVVAHQVGNAARGMNQWLAETINTLALDTGEYLQEESRDLPHPSQVEQFVADVDQVRMGVDRLDARVNRLAAKLMLQ